MNISTSADWCRRPVGIVRVEREVTKAVYSYFGSEVVPVYLDRNRDRWRTVDVGCFADIMSDEWVLSDQPDLDAARVHKHLSRFSPRAGDRFVTVGSDWSHKVPDKVGKLYGSERVMVAALYDLIPLMFPEMTPGSEFYDQFNYHYSALAKSARSVFSISETSAQALRDFWEEKSLTDIAPPIHVIPLAGPVPNSSSSGLDESDRVRLAEIQRDGPFILYVSTIEPRKNHQLLLDIWRDLYAERGENCPKLVIVGMQGWGSGDLMALASRMNAFRAGKVAFREGLSDALLLELYRESLFSVFPSYFEGWGLAATEAASFGKVCIVSNTGALSEATHGLMPSYHPLDFPGWKQEICRLLDDPAYREKLEARISTGQFQRSWLDFGQEFCERLLLDAS